MELGVAGPAGIFMGLSPSSKLLPAVPALLLAGLKYGFFWVLCLFWVFVGFCLGLWGFVVFFVGFVFGFVCFCWVLWGFVVFWLGFVGFLAFLWWFVLFLCL